MLHYAIVNMVVLVGLSEDAQDRLLDKDETCPARTQLIMSWTVFRLLPLLFYHPQYLLLNLSRLVALQGYGCFCSPCVPQPPWAAASAFGGLRVSGFAVILTVIPSLMVVAILLVCFYTIRKRRTNSSIPNAISYSELHIGTHSEVLGEGAHGLILKGTFCGVAVSVKRLLAPSNPAYPSAFDFEVNSKKSLDFGAGAAYLAGTRSSTSHMQASPSPNKTQRRRNSFLELVSDNLQVQPVSKYVCCEDKRKQYARRTLYCCHQYDTPGHSCTTN